MQFCPVGYIGLPETVRRVWTAFHPAEHDKAQAELAGRKAALSRFVQHQDVEILAIHFRACKHLDEAGKLLLQALASCELVALVCQRKGPLLVVPPNYWGLDGARMVTLYASTLDTASSSLPDLRNHHGQSCFIEESRFLAWLGRVYLQATGNYYSSRASVGLPQRAIDTFDQSYWNLLQTLAWVCLRDRGMVCKAADDAVPLVTALHFDILAAMHTASGRAVFYHREEAELAVRHAAQDEKLNVTGLRNGRGDRTQIPGLAWADLVFKFPYSSQPYATMRNADPSASRWNGLMFRRSELLAIWPAVPKVPTIAFLDLARAIAPHSTDERMVDDNMRRLRSDAVLGEFPSGTLGWNAREHLQRFDPEDPDEIVSFDPVTPIRIIHQLAELGDAVAEAVLTLSEGEACRRIAEAALPPNGSRARAFIESLAVTKSEARCFCCRHGMPVPDRLWESPIAWSDTVHVDAITVGELPSMPITELARRWSRELGESGLGDGSIWQAIWRAFWRGTLARNEGLLIPLVRHDTRSNIERFTRAKLLWAITRLADLPFTLQRQPESDAEGHVTEATEGDYDKVAEQWKEIVRRMEPGGWRDAYIDPAMLDRESFFAWCGRAGRRQPAFWTEAPTVADSNSGLVAHAATTDESAALGAYSEQRLRKWYEKRIANCESAGLAPSREQDWADARAELGNGVPRDAVRRLRRELAPSAWKRFGRRKSGGEKSGDD